MNSYVVEMVQENGYRLPQPELCPEFVYSWLRHQFTPLLPARFSANATFTVSHRMVLLRLPVVMLCANSRASGGAVTNMD